MPTPHSSTVTFRRVPADFSRRTIERFARLLQMEVAQGRPFDCLITGDAELRRLNCEFLDNDYATDVLSFPGVAPAILSPVTLRPRTTTGDKIAGATGPHLGDIAISFPRARAQARAFGHSAGQEIQILMLHGLLHLLGMDHTADGGRMARAEKRWRARLGLPTGLIERVRQ
jgi:probable rRNA maturation factor